ncbi:Na+/H+ antiporter NhaA [Sphingobacterium faecium]
MSIFISILSYENPLYVNEVKLAILILSILAGIMGYYIVRNIVGKKLI